MFTDLSLTLYRTQTCAKAKSVVLCLSLSAEGCRCVELESQGLETCSLRLTQGSLLPVTQSRMTQVYQTAAELWHLCVLDV